MYVLNVFLKLNINSFNFLENITIVKANSFANTMEKICENFWRKYENYDNFLEYFQKEANVTVAKCIKKGKRHFFLNFPNFVKTKHPAKVLFEEKANSDLNRQNM
jgi:hypothetical protein